MGNLGCLRDIFSSGSVNISTDSSAHVLFGIQVLLFKKREVDRDGLSFCDDLRFAYLYSGCER
jgi:hypothetical protein